MRLGWLLVPLLLSPGIGASAQEVSHTAVGDQLAALSQGADQPRLSLNARENRVDLAYDIRRLRPAVGERAGGRSRVAVARSQPSIDALGLPLQGEGALVDIYPFREGLRITAGARSDPSDARFMARAWKSMGESDRAVAATLNSKADGFTPYVGIGYARRMLDGRLQVSVDAGVLFDREYDSESADEGAAALATVTDTGEGTGSGGTSSDVYPVVGLSMKYRF